MAHVVYMGVQTAHVLSGVSNRIMFSAAELAVHAAAAALKSIRASNAEGSDQKNLVDHPMVKDELEAMDIEAKLKTVHALVLTIQKQRGKTGAVQTTGDGNANEVITEERDESDVVGVCLEQVKEVLDSITSTVNSLNEELDLHEQRWFSSWRTPDTKHYLIALKAKMLILDKRLDMLLKVRSFVSEPGLSSHASSSQSASSRGSYLEYASGSYGKQASYALTSM